MKSASPKLALATVLFMLMMSCTKSGGNSESQKSNSTAQPTATPTTATATPVSGKGGGGTNAGTVQGISAEGAATAQSELSTATRELLGIMLRGETSAAAQRLTDDYKNTRPDGTVEDKAQYLANLKPFKDFDGFIFDEFKVEKLEGDTAVVSGLVQAWGKDKKSFTGRFKETFVKREGKWLLQSSQNEELKPID
jgi:hypothetical protein